MSILRKTSLVPAFLIAAGFAAHAATAQAVVTDSAFAANALAANDDGSTDDTTVTGPLQPGTDGSVAVPFNLDFFGTTYNSLYVNNNGNTTFGLSLSQPTPVAFDSNGSDLPPTIGAYFADVDTRGTGSGLTSYGLDTLDGHQVFGVDWPDVGYFSAHTDLLNNFQELLIDRSDIASGDFDIEFNYNQIQWETGDSSGGTGGFGGTPAVVGYTAGTGTPGSFFTLPGSLTTGQFEDGDPLALISHEQDATDPIGAIEDPTAGRYVFEVRGGNVLPPSVPAAVPEPSSLALLLPGALGLFVVARRRRSA